MPLGIVNDSDFQLEIDKLNGNSPTTTIIKPLYNGGRREGDKGVPEVLKKIIGENALEEGNKTTQEGLSRALGISDSSVTAYKNGATSTKTYNKKERNLESFLEMARSKIIKKSSKKLNLALDYITPNSLDGVKPIDLSNIAKNMSAIIRNLEPPVDKNNSNIVNNGPTFIVYAPKMKTEDAYDVMHVTE